MSSVCKGSEMLLSFDYWQNKLNCDTPYLEVCFFLSVCLQILVITIKVFKMDDQYLNDLLRFQSKYNTFREESDYYENDSKIPYNEISPSSSPLTDSPLSSSCTTASILSPPPIERVRRLLYFYSSSIFLPLFSSWNLVWFF